MCTNNVNLPKGAVEEAVLTALQDDLLRPDGCRRCDPPRDGAVGRAEWRAGSTAWALRGELQQVEGELANLAAAIANGGQSTSLLTGLKDREARRTQLQEQLNVLEAAGQGTPHSLGEVEGTLCGDLDDWRGLLCKHAAQPRQMIRKLLEGRLVFTPKIDAGKQIYEFRGQGNLGRLLEGAARLPKAWVSPGRCTGYSFSPA